MHFCMLFPGTFIDALFGAMGTAFKFEVPVAVFEGILFLVSAVTTLFVVVPDF